MKQTRAHQFIELLVVGLLCSASWRSPAQTSTDGGPYPTNNYIPVVTIKATDPLANWSGNPGVFTVLRNGNLQPSLNIYYQVSGTASNGVDYQQIGNFVQIPS